jgi:hypothetical protein
MKKQRQRAYARAQYRENKRRLKTVSREANDIRERHDLCRHADERKIYRTIEERDNDQSPPLLCDYPECGRRRLRIAVFLKVDADLPTETAEAVLTHFLG